MLTRLKSRLLNHQRSRALTKVQDPQFRALMTAPIEVNRPWREYDFLALDIETTGLDPHTVDVVSFGWIPVTHARVQVSGAVRLLVRTPTTMNDSATVHGIRQQDLADGVKLRTAMEQLMEALQDRVLLVHYSGLDKVLLDRLCRELYGSSLWVPVVDTLEVARHQLRHEPIEPGQLRLMSLVKRFGLPETLQHDALNDALATAQLFLALTTRRRQRDEPRLCDLL